MEKSGEVKFTLLGAFENGLATWAALERAVIISLFTDAPANADDALPDGTLDRRGYWADTTSPPADAPANAQWITGSKLWLLWREKQTQTTANRAKFYAEAALQWLIAGHYATQVTVDAYWATLGLLMLPVKITLADGTLWQKEFSQGAS